MLRSDLCDFSDTYIVVKGNIIVANPNNNTYDKKFALKNNPPFLSCISKIKNTLVDNAEDLDMVMPTYNLLEYSKKNRKLTGSLWNYYSDEPNSGAVGNIDYSIKDSKPFDYKTSITGKLEGSNVEKDDAEIVVTLKFLSKIFKSLNILLVNCKLFLILTWSENCVITSKPTREADADGDPVVAGINNPTNAVFKITDCKFYVPVFTLSAENNNKLLNQLKTKLKKTITCNKYRSEMSNQTKNNNRNYLIDPKFTNVNRLFV